MHPTAPLYVYKPFISIGYRKCFYTTLPFLGFASWPSDKPDYTKKKETPLQNTASTPTATISSNLPSFVLRSSLRLVRFNIPRCRLPHPAACSSRRIQHLQNAAFKRAAPCLRTAPCMQLVRLRTTAVLSRFVGSARCEGQATFAPRDSGVGGGRGEQQTASATTDRPLPAAASD